MRVSPRLVAASYILELSSMELQQAIAQELEENPAIELVEQAACQVCGGPLHGSICPSCLSLQKGPAAGEDEYGDVDDYSHDRSLAAPLDDDFDPMTQVASQMTLEERLLNDLRATIPREDYRIAQYLVGSLNDNGYLQTSIEEVAYELSVDKGRVEAVLAALQTLDPVGIGARNLRECLLIQLDFLEEQGSEVPPLARSIVEDHLTALAEHKYSRIAHALGTTTEQVSEVGRFIRERLNPFPARGGSAPEPGDVDARASRVIPDVIINRFERNNGDEVYEVDVVESKRFFLRVAPVYHRLAAELDREPQRYSDDDRRHVRQYVSRAKLFIANINQRRQTMQKITEHIVEVQRDFLRCGIRQLKPLTRAAVATQLGMHESTVSRATAGKYVMLPNRKVIPFSDFFTASLSVMDVIKELIANEDVPKTDQEIADELGRRGIPLARRTVAKYREQLNILPSSLR
jgi:RNA polymerase sigma-54 factor